MNKYGQCEVCGRRESCNKHRLMQYDGTSMSWRDALDFGLCSIFYPDKFCFYEGLNPNLEEKIRQYAIIQVVAPPNVSDEYCPETGELYMALLSQERYVKKHYTSAEFCVVPINGKKIVLRNGAADEFDEYKILKRYQSFFSSFMEIPPDED